jgi:IS30 family transposase
VHLSDGHSADQHLAVRHERERQRAAGQYPSKGRDLNACDVDELRLIEHRLNNRPCRTLHPNTLT